MSIDTRWTFSVTAGSNLQDVLNAARPGDIIQLQADATFVGNFTLPAKPQNQNSPQWIVIRSDASDANLPPAGTRVQPSFAPFLPKLVSPNQDPALKTDAGAEFYSLFGVELTVDPSVSENGGVVAFGDGSQTLLSEVPSNLVLDRCYIHGTPTQNTYRGVALNSAYTTITECYISDFHKQRLADSGGPDAQAISGWNGPGPFQIVNCYLEGGDENVLFGGVDPAITDLVPSNITFSSNYCSKPFSWRLGDPSYDGRDWRIKNIFELKNAQRVMIEGNVFEHCWVNGDQNATAIVFTPRNQDGAAPWSVVQDVIFRNNIVLHSGQGLRTLGVDDTHQSLPLKRITIENNLFADIDGDKWGREGTAVDGRWLGIT
ncbi:MAG: hypothetical protein M3Z24_08720, partial [Chloroflexota bacterium]|nr:hypothetical protein [Chloroflexota bacterium]